MRSRRPLEMPTETLASVPIMTGKPVCNWCVQASFLTSEGARLVASGRSFLTSRQLHLAGLLPKPRRHARFPSSSCLPSTSSFSAATSNTHSVNPSLARTITHFHPFTHSIYSPQPRRHHRQPSQTCRTLLGLLQQGLPAKRSSSAQDLLSHARGRRIDKG